MIGETAFGGGSRKLTLSAEYHISPQHERVGVYDPTASLYAVRLSDARQHRAGATAHVVCNSSGSNNLTVKDKAGNTLTTVGPGKAREFEVLSNASQAGEWLWTAESTFAQGGTIP